MFQVSILYLTQIKITLYLARLFSCDLGFWDAFLKTF